MSISIQEFSGGKALRPVGSVVSGQDFMGGQPLQQAPQSQGPYASQTLQNAPGSLGKFAGGIASALFHPVETTKTLGKLAIGGLEQLIPGQAPEGTKAREYEQLAGTVGQDYKQAYGGLENIKTTFKEDPFRVLSDVAAVGSLGFGAAAKVSKVAGLTRTAEVASKAASVANVLDPFVSAGKILKGAANKATGVSAGLQKFTAPVLSGVNADVIGGIQNATYDAARYIKEGMRSSSATSDLVAHIGNVIEGVDKNVWKIARQEASKIPALVPVGGIYDNALERLRNVGILISSKMSKGKNPYQIGVKALEGGRLTRSMVDSAIVPVLEDFWRLKNQGKTLTTNQLWDKAQLVSNGLKKLEGLAGYEDAFNAIHGAVVDAMPAGFWDIVRSQDAVRQAVDAVKATFGGAGRAGYAKVPGKAAQTTELRLGQLFGKGKTQARSNISKLEKIAQEQVQRLQELTGMTIDELVKSGALTQDVADAMKNPQLLNLALGQAVSTKMPTVLRVLSAGGGSLNSALATFFGYQAGGAPGAMLGIGLGSPRVQGELANAFGAAKRAGGAGNLYSGTRVGQGVAGAENIANILRALTQSQQQ